MRIIGCDLHARQQAIAMLDTDTGELEERTLGHEGETVREFYSALSGPILVGKRARAFTLLGFTIISLGFAFQRNVSNVRALCNHGIAEPKAQLPSGPGRSVCGRTRRFQKFRF